MSCSFLTLQRRFIFAVPHGSVLGPFTFLKCFRSPKLLCVNYRIYNLWSENTEKKENKIWTQIVTECITNNSEPITEPCSTLVIFLNIKCYEISISVI